MATEVREGDPRAPLAQAELLRTTFDPRSIAVVGASSTPGKWGHRMAVGALAGRHRRAVYMVNPTRPEVLGHPSHASVDDLPAPPEMVVLCVPATAFEEAADSALEGGAKVLVGITSDVAGAVDLISLRRRIRSAGAILVGPNCAGLGCPATGLSLAVGELPAGGIGLVSQSGAVAFDTIEALGRLGCGVSHVMTLGDQLDLDAATMVDHLAADPTCRVVCCYVEDFGNGRRFVEAAARATAGGTSVVVLAGGRSAPAARAAQSHTGALLGSHAVTTAAVRAAGGVLVESPRALAVAAIVAGVERPSGTRFAVVGDAGGHGVLAADTIDAAGGAVPPFTEVVCAKLAAAVPLASGTANPVDLGAAADAQSDAYTKALELVLQSSEVDAAFLVGGFGALTGRQEEAGELAVAESIAAVAGSTRCSLVVQTFAASTPAVRHLIDTGIPVIRDVADIGTATTTLLRGEPRIPKVIPVAENPLIETDYWAARALLSSSGVSLPFARRVTSVQEAVTAAESIGFPVVIKAIGAVHKSDSGGVVVGVRDVTTARNTAQDLFERLDPPSLSVEVMAPIDRGVELLVGARRDAHFGPAIAVGFGGILAETLNDVATVLAPCDPADVIASLGRLRGRALLDGVRGRPAVDVPAIARLAVLVGNVLAAHPELSTIECNPVLGLSSGAIALDARVELVARP